ncbi:MAG TPA: methylated-DNA--[protein]-cysteine S-methyltransferase [Nitriliruptorales bacterium]
MRCAVIESPIGPLTLVGNGVGIRELRYGRDVRAHPEAPVEDDPLLGAVAAQLRRYFAGDLEEFDVPVSWGDVTPFQKAVYEAMSRTTYGEMVSYGDLAREVGSPRASRAVGQACNRNPLPILVPCHRVVASDGSLGGYGAGLEAKRHLLALERGGDVPGGGWEPAHNAVR